jgi:hypothetical protein
MGKPVPYGDEKVANRTVRVEIAHAAVSRRPPISFDTIVAPTGGYTYAATVTTRLFSRRCARTSVDARRVAAPAQQLRGGCQILPLPI